MKAMQAQPEGRRKLLDAALHVIRSKGYTATRVDDICDAAQLTKGGFFHYFKGKEDLALAAAECWTARTAELFANAPYQSIEDPVDRLLAYIDFRKALLQGELPEFTCLIGTMVQEVYETHPALREACERSIWGHAETLEPDIAAAMEKYGVRGDWTAESLALYTQAVIQGAFILAKAKGGPEVAAESMDHLRRYVELLFGKTDGGPESESTAKKQKSAVENAMTMRTATAEKTPGRKTESEMVDWPATHYVFVEKTGPIQKNASQAWSELHALRPTIEERNTIIGFLSLYDMAKRIYRAGVAVADEPKELPGGVRYERFAGGRYARFAMAGSYDQLGEATGRAMQLAHEKKLPARAGWNIEHYVNDPRVTPADQLIKEILLPMK